MFQRCLLAAVVGLAIIGSAAADQPRSMLTLVTYPVADLVVPILGTRSAVAVPGFENRGQATTEERLIRLIVQNVVPGTWADAGGQGTIQYFPLGQSIMIKQTDAVHQQLATFLRELRRPQDVEIAVEVRLLQVRQEAFEAALKHCQNGQTAGWTALAQWWNHRTVHLSAAQQRQFLDSVNSDQTTRVMQAPKVTLFHQQSATVTVATERGAKKREVSLTLQPSAAQDRSSVGLRLQLKTGSIALDTTVNIADGGTAVIGPGPGAGEANGRLILVVVTPRIIVTEEEIPGLSTFQEASPWPK